MEALSLFAGGGIGDLALRSAGVDMVVANELLEERADLVEFNFPDSNVISGDIWKAKDSILSACRCHSIELVLATPPCQGMSKNGRGKLLSGIRDGSKDPIDPRNLLVVPTIDIFLELNAHTLIMENVPEMKDTLIPSQGGTGFIGILDYIRLRLGPKFVSQVKVVEFADYGVPQFRQRLISIFSCHPNIVSARKNGINLFPPPTHSKPGAHIGLPPWRTVRDAIEHLPALDASTINLAESKDINHHRVPTLDQRKYFWVSSTPPESGAFDNQCVKCGFEGNPVHGAKKNFHGINRSNKTTPIYCLKCHSLLPRPTTVEANGKVRLMSGFTSAYKRMKWDEPASTLTRNLSYACSDKKLHPDQHRVLSLYEAMIIHTIDDYSYEWKRASGKRVSDKLIREVIGESIPPLGLESVFRHVLSILSKGFSEVNNSKAQVNVDAFLASSNKQLHLEMPMAS
jgi:DNA (cytosine-5)-methyltransferase 1